MVFVFIAGSFSCTNSNSKPIIGEVYVLKDNNLYTTWKITNIHKNIISYIPNDYQVSEKYLADSINYPKNYTDTPLSISEKDFKKIQNIYLLKPN